MKTETAKIENFTNIEAIKDKLKKEVTSLRDELKNYKKNLLEEQERIDEEKMQRLELEEQISEMRKRIKTEATEKAKELWFRLFLTFYLWFSDTDQWFCTLSKPN